MAENQVPSVLPADDSTLSGVIKTAVRKVLQGTDNMMPVEVVAYDRATNRATVKHLIQMEGSNGEKVDRGQVSSVRVYQFGNGTFSMSLPIKPGDKGWLHAADRDLSVFQQDVDKIDAPNTERMHSFQDGVFMPDAMKMGDVAPADADRVTIQLNEGGAVISLGSNGMTFTVGGVSMDISAAGIVITGGTVKHNGKNIGSTHTHGGITSGPSNTAVPNP